MIKTNPALKKITIDIRGAITRLMVNGYFSENETGEIEFTPYFRNKYQLIAFGLYALEGAEFEKGDDIEGIILEDDNIFQIYNAFIATEDFIEIKKDVEDMVAFQKQQLLHKSKLEDAFDSLNTLLVTMNEKLSQIDAKGLEKSIKKFNVKELMKEYQKSGNGDVIRDKAIQDLVKENKELRNENSVKI